MVDRDQLRAQHRVAVLTCSAVTIVPLLLTFVAGLLAEPGIEGGAGSGTADPILLLVFGSLALTPLVSVPIVRRIGLTALKSAQVTAVSLGSTLMVWKVTEFALWELCSLLGFVGFLAGASWTFLLVCVALSLIGYAFSFPRWSEWEERADEFDANRTVSRTPAPRLEEPS
jgi:hypothetical protein